MRLEILPGAHGLSTEIIRQSVGTLGASRNMRILAPFGTWTWLSIRSSADLLVAGPDGDPVNFDNGESSASGPVELPWPPGLELWGEFSSGNSCAIAVTRLNRDDPGGGVVAIPRGSGTRQVFLSAPTWRHVVSRSQGALLSTSADGLVGPGRRVQFFAANSPTAFWLPPEHELWSGDPPNIATVASGRSGWAITVPWLRSRKAVAGAYSVRLSPGQSATLGGRASAPREAIVSIRNPDAVGGNYDGLFGFSADDVASDRGVFVSGMNADDGSGSVASSWFQPVRTLLPAGEQLWVANPSTNGAEVLEIGAWLGERP